MVAVSIPTSTRLTAHCQRFTATSLATVCGICATSIFPASDCGNSLPLNPPADAQTCTRSEFVRRTLQYQCMPSVGQPLIDALLQSGSNCDSFVTILVDGCATNANGQRCGDVISMDLIASASSDSLLSTLAKFLYIKHHLQLYLP